MQWALHVPPRPPYGLTGPSTATQKYGINAQVIPIVLIFLAFFIFHVFFLLVTFVLVLSTHGYLFSIMLIKVFSHFNHIFFDIFFM